MAQNQGGGARARDVTVPAQNALLKGILAVPRGARGVVLFAHGSGSGRLSTRNNFVARSLQTGGLATLLIDLLTEDEGEDRRFVFDIDLLASRLLAATAWLRRLPETRPLSIGYFGASTGAAAALQAAAQEGDAIGAMVSRGGRPDLARDYLPTVTAPTLFIVGGDDLPVITLNQQAHDLLRCTKELVIIPGATHLFPEPGALEEVARLAREWFQRYLVRGTERAV